MNHQEEKQGHTDHMTDLPGQTVKDPVCGMNVDTKSASDQFEYEGRTFYFCSQHCLQKFVADPGKYTD